jgi:hypothetical protein
VRLTDPKEPLRKEDAHRYWWLRRDLAEENRYFLIKDPKVVKVLKGRPPNVGGPFASTGEAQPRAATQPRAARGSQRLTSSIRRNPSD